MLAKEGITSILVEGGHEVLNSFTSANIIDQIYIYTVAHNLGNPSLQNPLKISDKWIVKEESILGEDQLIMAEKGVECLQES